MSKPTSTKKAPASPKARASAMSPEGRAQLAAAMRERWAKKGLRVAEQKPPKRRQLTTLTDLDVLPASPGRIVSLSDMTVPQLGEAFEGLEKAQGQYESMSGICATLSGLVLQEVKKKVGRGNYQPWLKERFPKSQKTACLYIRLAEEFSKADPKVSFDQMTLALLDGAQGREGQSLDFANPLVARVSKWAKGRSFYQLRQEELSPGGNNHPECPHCGADLGTKTQPICPQCGKETELAPKSPEEIRAELMEDTRQWAQEQLTDKRAAHKLYRLLPDHEAEALAAHYRGLAKEIEGWVKTPARKREELSLEEALA